MLSGRPLALSGNWKAAPVVMDKNLQMIDASQADIIRHLLPDLLQNIQGGLPVEYKNHAPHGIYRHADPGRNIKG